MIQTVVATDPILLVFSDDWGRHPSSCQHLIRHLLDRYEVYWVNTIGTRTPSLDLSTLARCWEKLRHWTRPNDRNGLLPTNLHVLNPWMWPWFSSPFHRTLNRKLLLRQLRPIVERSTKPVIGITTLPIVADVMTDLPVSRWVYYCVDDFGHWPGLDQISMRSMEADLIHRADRFIAVSDNLRAKLSAAGRQSRLLTHGIDLDHWNHNGQNLSLPEFDRLERPLVLFWGVIDRRMDVGLLKQLAADLSRGTIVLVGPESDPDPELFGVPRVIRLPPVHYDQLPYLAREAHVLIMPYTDSPVTRAMQPLKLKEYLATGKPTVVRDLPSVRSWADCLDTADCPESFSELVRLRIRDGMPDSQGVARNRLAREGWAEKARQFEHWILEEESSLPQ